jgi:(p)ppGpp synthase/HD superfamily hydrolase
MEDVNNWQSKFAPCQYSDKLLNKLSLLNEQAKSPVDISEVTKAIYYARKYHGSQMRKSGEPYYSHPIEVAYLFAEYAGIENEQYYTTDLVATSILHDCIEDTVLTKNMIEQIFNQSIASKVQDLTRIKFDQKITAGEILNNLLSQNKIDLAYIKLFDRLHNSQTIGHMPPEKVKKILNETIKQFIFLSLTLEATDVEKELIEICYKYLSKPQEQEHKFSYQEYYQLPSLT